MNRAEFERLLVEAVALIPKRFRREIKNLALVVEDAPSAELLDEMEIEPPDTLYGLYQGTPLTERTWQYGNQLPDRITLFQQPIEEDCDDEDEVRAVIGETLIHEVGHYFGMSEEQIEEAGTRNSRSGIRDSGFEIRPSKAPSRAQTVRSTFPRASMGCPTDCRGGSEFRRHLPRDWPGPRCVDSASCRTGRPSHRSRNRS